MHQHERQQTDSPWPHRLAVLLVCATFPLIWVGSLVTTYDAGMAVEDWPTTYGYNLFLYPWKTWLFGPWDLFIEHGHRLLGAAVGLLTIALAVVVWFHDRRKWLRYASLGAVAAVTGQGILGGMRVLQDEVQLAKIHACTGPLFFCLTVALAVVTSRVWKDEPNRKVTTSPGSLHRLAWMTLLFAYVQLVIGAQLRHIPATAEPQVFRLAVFFHLVLATVVAVHAVLLWLQVRRVRQDVPSLRIPATALVGLVAVQLPLGAATWLVKYSWPMGLVPFLWGEQFTIVAEGMLQSLTVTVHVANGSLILATAVLLALRAQRLVRAAPGMTRLNWVLWELAA